MNLFAHSISANPESLTHLLDKIKNGAENPDLITAISQIKEVGERFNADSKWSIEELYYDGDFTEPDQEFKDLAIDFSGEIWYQLCKIDFLLKYKSFTIETIEAELFEIDRFVNEAMKLADEPFIKSETMLLHPDIHIREYFRVAYHYYNFNRIRLKLDDNAMWIYARYIMFRAFLRDRLNVLKGQTTAEQYALYRYYVELYKFAAPFGTFADKDKEIEEYCFDRSIDEEEFKYNYKYFVKKNLDKINSTPSFKHIQDLKKVIDLLSILQPQYYVSHIVEHVKVDLIHAEQLHIKKDGVSFSDFIIPILYESLKVFVSEVQHEALINSFKNGSIEKINVKVQPRQFAELMRRVKYNNYLWGKDTVIAKWICKNFQFENVTNPNIDHIKDVLSKAKRDINVKSKRICNIDELPHHSHKKLNYLKEKEESL